MRLNDESDYEKEDRADLITRLLLAQQMGHFLLSAYSALRSYGVDFMGLPEWKDKTLLDEAAKLKPHAAQSKVMLYIERLHSALAAAIRRKQIRPVK